MATISNIQELLPVLGAVATTRDPIAALEQEGHQISPALRNRLQVRKTPKPGEQERWAKQASHAGRLTFRTGPAPKLAARELAAGEFEFSAGLRMGTANEIVAGLHANHTIPDVLFLDELLSQGDLTALGGAFQVDKPGGRIGRLQITAPPTLSPVGDGQDRIALTIPFRLNFERISRVAGRTIRTVVTFGTGRMRLIVRLTTRTVPVSIAARNLEIQVDLSQSFEARMEMDANSPVQRRNPPAPGQTDGIAVIIQNALQQRLKDTLKVTISAAIPLPIGRLEIHETAVITRGDSLVAGVKVQGTPSPGNPQTLQALFPNPDTNFFTRVHDSVLRLIVQSAARNGELTRIAKQTHPDAVIDSADVSFGNGTIKLQAKGKIVDLCPAGVDLGFTVTMTVKVTMEGTRIRIDRETSKDLDNLDAFLCVVTSLGLALLAAVAVIVFQGIGLASGLAAGYALGVVGVLTVMLEFDGDDFALVFGGGGDDGPMFIDLDFPLPGTDLLPRLTGAFIRLDESTMLIAAHLGTRPDTINTYFYLQFFDPDDISAIQGRPIVGAKVRLMDRDSPAPAGDDLVLPGPKTATTGQHLPTGDFRITTKTSFQRTPDEALAEGTTDSSGRVRFYIPKDKLKTKGANKVVETTRTNLDTDEEIKSTRRTPVPEERPDLYFRVIRANGTTSDTLQVRSGFFLNFQSARVGTPASPLVIDFGGGVGGVGGGGVVVADSRD
ncbi:MAG: hypothetical protein IT168_30800 [Bryobacterales bacterium]|nr:hypothetical protein [Bryobacterales bacterium]